MDIWPTNLLVTIYLEHKFPWNKLLNCITLGQRKQLQKWPESWYFSLSPPSVQFSRPVVSDLCRPVDCSLRWPQASLSITNFWSLLKLMSIESMMLSSHLILCHPLVLLPSVLPSNRVFSNESVLCIKWPKYWSFSFSISPFNEHSELISFRMDWFDLLAVQGTLKSLLQHQLKSTNSLVLSFLYSPTLTSIHDY